MAGEGWEGGAFVFPNPYWGDYTREGDGLGVDADSSSLDPNDQPREGEARLNMRRFALGKSFSRGRAEPGGALVFRPTISYMPLFMMNTCQAVGCDALIEKGKIATTSGSFVADADQSGSNATYTHVKGTVVFMPVMDQISFGTGDFGTIGYGTGGVAKWSTTLGGVVGTGTAAKIYGLGSGGTLTAGDVFPITAISYFGEDMNDGQFVENAITDSLEINLQVGDNVMWTWNAMGGNYLQSAGTEFGTGAGQIDVEDIDYAISEQEFAEFECQVTVDGNDYDLEGFDFTILNSLNRVGGLGHRFPQKLRVQGDLPMGNISWELTDLDIMKVYDTVNIELAMYGNKYSSGTWTQDTDTWMKMIIPDAKIMDYTREIRGDSPMQVQIPFHAYRHGDKGKEPPFTVAVAGVFNTFGMRKLWDHITSQK